MTAIQTQNGDRCACGGRYEPQTNGNGGLIDRCLKCNAKRGHTVETGKTFLGRPAAPLGQAPRIPASALPGSPCSVDGCPGALASDGKCPCCVKRKAFIEAHAPSKPCGICGGVIKVAKNRKFCTPCAKAKAQYGPTTKG